MLIKIDTREKDLYNLCKLEAENVLFETLAVGDIIIYDDENNEKIIIERKTLYDLAASIKDGRYAEQSFILNNYTMHNHNIIYLIEFSLIGIIAFDCIWNIIGKISFVWSKICAQI